MTSRSLGYRAPLLWLVLPFIAGLIVGDVSGWTASSGFLGVAALAAITAVLASPRRPWAWGVALSLSMVLAGMGSYAIHRARLRPWESLPAREAKMSLQVDRVFAQADPKRATGLGTIVAADEPLREITGQKIYFSLTLRRGEVAPIRSAVISAMGVLMVVPLRPPADSFDGYLAGAGVNFRLTRGRVLAVKKPPGRYYRFCADAADRCDEILGQGIAKKRPALAGLLRAMMLGATHELSREQHTLFMQSGTMHLFAISGLNIGVIASALQALMLLLRFPLWVRFVIGAALLWLFVDITGASPSAVRAFAMAIFVQAAFALRRPANLLAAINAAALVVLLVSPLQVFSASFLMSYGIVLALLLLGVPLGECLLARWAPWRHLPKPAWNGWHRAAAHAWRASATALAIGLATTLVSLVTGVLFFNLLTPGSLLANLALIPAAVIVTLAGFASLMCGFVGLGFGVALCNHAAALVLLLIEGLVRLSVKLPGAFVPAHFVAPWIGPTALIVLLALLLAGYATQWKPPLARWWPPFAVVALTLVFGVKFG